MTNHALFIIMRYSPRSSFPPLTPYRNLSKFAQDLSISCISPLFLAEEERKGRLEPTTLRRPSGQVEAGSGCVVRTVSDAPRLCSSSPSSPFPGAATPDLRHEHSLSLSAAIGAFENSQLASRHPEVRHREQRDEQFGTGTNFSQPSCHRPTGLRACMYCFVTAQGRVL